jgi:hypothetical protein
MAEGDLDKMDERFEKLEAKLNMILLAVLGCALSLTTGVVVLILQGGH